MENRIGLGQAQYQTKIEADRIKPDLPVGYESESPAFSFFVASGRVGWH